MGQTWMRIASLGGSTSELAPDSMHAQSSAPVECASKNMAQRRPKSPRRFAMNAFFPAAAFGKPSYQKPIRRYEQSPTPSHPMKSTGKLSPSTRMSIEKTKRFMYAKKRANPFAPV